VQNWPGCEICQPKSALLILLNTLTSVHPQVSEKGTSTLANLSMIDSPADGSIAVVIEEAVEGAVGDIFIHQILIVMTNILIVAVQDNDIEIMNLVNVWKNCAFCIIVRTRVGIIVLKVARCSSQTRQHKMLNTERTKISFWKVLQISLMVT
jgi:hypothetical protein